MTLKCDKKCIMRRPQTGRNHPILKVFIVIVTAGVSALLVILATRDGRIFTNEDGVWADEVYAGAEDASTAHVPDGDGSHSVRLDRSGRPARLVIRYAAGHGAIYSVYGHARLLSASGVVLWRTDFDGLTEDPGPAVFTCGFLDVDGDGTKEVLFRRALTREVYEDGEPVARHGEPGPLHIERTDGTGRPVTPEDIQARGRVRLAGWRLAHPMRGFLAGLGETAVAALVLLAPGLLVLLVTGAVLRRGGIPCPKKQETAIP